MEQTLFTMAFGANRIVSLDEEANTWGIVLKIVRRGSAGEAHFIYPYIFVPDRYRMLL